MGLDDPQKFEEGLENERERLLSSDSVYAADVPVIRRWLRDRSGSVKTSSLKTYLRRVRVASERAPMPLVEMDKDGFADLIFSLRHDHDLSDSTIKSYENAVLPFLDWVSDGDADWTEDWERTQVADEGPTQDEILTPDDIQALTEAANYQRDVALIEFWADTGARLSLTLSLRIRDVELFNTGTPTYQPNPNAAGLKGAPITDYPLIDSAAAIRSYLRSAHPRPNEPDAALFHKLKPASRGDDGERWTDDGGLAPNAAAQQIARVADRTDVDKPVKPHAFRHTAITRMVREGYSRSQIEHRVHWTLDTDMWETYEHITASQHTEDIFREAGVIDDEDSPDAVRRPCGNCRQPLAPHHEFCSNCGQPATADAAESVEEDESTLLDDIVDSTNPATRRELRALLDEIEERPDLAHDDDSS